MKLTAVEDRADTIVRVADGMLPTSFSAVFTGEKFDAFAAITLVLEVTAEGQVHTVAVTARAWPGTGMQTDDLRAIKLLTLRKLAEDAAMLRSTPIPKEPKRPSLEEVARVYNEIKASGVRGTVIETAKVFGKTQSTTNKWVIRARAAGLVD